MECVGFIESNTPSLEMQNRSGARGFNDTKQAAFLKSSVLQKSRGVTWSAFESTSKYFSLESVGHQGVDAHILILCAGLVLRIPY